MNNNFQKLTRIKCFLLDMDGTFYLGRSLLPGALDFLRLLDRKTINFLFLTNNSSKSKVEYAEKLRGMGCEINEEKIFTSGEATAIHLSKINPAARVFLVGTPALEAEFLRFGFSLTDAHPDFAVLGFDTTLTYQKLNRLCELLVSGVPYIATHPDINCPTETGFMPDIGSMMEMIAASTGRRPDIIIGKPYQPIIDAISQKLHLPVDQICMVGDRLYTDIALGKSGILTVLVLSGETKAEDLHVSTIQPDFIMTDLAELTATLASF